MTIKEGTMEQNELIATPVKDRIVVDNLYDYAGVGYLEIKVEDWAGVKRLPEVLDVRGRLYAYSGWNSDRMVAYFRTDRVTGKAVR